MFNHRPDHRAWKKLARKINEATRDKNPVIPAPREKIPSQGFWVVVGPRLYWYGRCMN